MKVQIIKAICFFGQDFNHRIICFTERGDQFAEAVGG